MELKVLELNVHSLINIKKREELKFLIKRTNADIIMLCETYLNPNHKFNIPNFSIYRSDRLAGPGGGTAIIIKNKIKHEVVNPPILKSKIEVTIIKIYLQNIEMMLISVYNPEKLDVGDLKTLLNIHSHVVIIGDFNSRNEQWNCANNNSNGIKLRKFIFDHIEEVQLHFPNSPTFYPGCPEYSPSILDIAISKKVNINHTPYTLDLFDSDHLPVMFKISTRNKLVAPVLENKFNFAKANWKLFREKIDLQIQHNVLINNEDELNYFTNYLTEVISKSVNLSVPIFETKNKLCNLPEIVEKMIKEKTRLRRIWRREIRRGLNRVNLAPIKSQINLLNKLIEEQINLHQK